jgi:hypothetical protein
MIRDNLDLGRPDRVQLYKHTTIKQYHNEGRALRTETTINDTFDFNIGRRLTNLPALRKIGFSANRRLLDVQRLSHDPADGTTTLAAITEPIHIETGQRVTGMRFTDDRVQALFSVLCMFRLLARGFTNRDLREHLEPLLGRVSGTLSRGQGIYDLRRLRHHGLIECIPHSHRYRVTTEGHRQVLFPHELTTDSSATGWPNSAKPSRSQQEASRGQRVTPTTAPSTSSATAPDLPPDPNLTQPARQTRLKQSSPREWRASRFPERALIPCRLRLRRQPPPGPALRCRRSSRCVRAHASHFVRLR